MKYNKNIYIGEFVNRPNRFNALVRLNGEEIVVHVPNTGRCKEILREGSRVLLREETNPTRKTLYDLVAVYKGEELISIDSQIPNKVVEEALKDGKIEKLKKYNNILREKTFGKSRFDFKLANEEGEEYYLEVKGATLEDEGHVRFPDAPTDRGRKHLLELIDVKESGRGAGVMFLVQIKNVKTFSPNDDTDPKFGEALRKAYESGVDVFAYNCIVEEEGITLYNEIEVRL